MNSLKTILHVEDDPDIQAVAKLALESIGGYKIHTCSSGREAIECVMSEKPQLMLLDVMMPVLDGLSTYQAIRSLPEGANLPVIFVTAKVQKHEIEEYKYLGAAGVICKPFDAMTLAQTVENIWNEWQNSRDQATISG